MTGYGGSYERTGRAASGARTGTNGLAVAGLVCGVVGVFLFNIILGPLAVIFGTVGLRRSRTGAGGRGMSIAAIVLGVVDVLLFVVLLIAAANSGGSFYFNYG
ncbi:DUF4190 domain-containing protein [Embleya sp. NPDC001921]